MRAVSSFEPLTKRWPSGSSAREDTVSVWFAKVRRTAPSLRLTSLMVLPYEAESACWLSSATRAFTSRVCERRPRRWRPTLKALPAATLTTLHVGAARAMWCAS